MNMLASPNEMEYEPLYAARKNIYPQKVSGTFRRIKWTLMAICLGIYYFVPFIRWDRGPNAPNQAVLIDFPSRRFYFFFIEIWPQEVYYITGLLIIAAMILFLMNALGGRIWCGYLCPQTVWTDLFYAVERFIEGDRRERIKKDSQPFSLRRGAEIGAKHFLWLMIAWWTGGAWVLYFSDAPTLVKELAIGEAPIVAYIWIGILTFTTYSLAGFMREQVCVYMCPWPRIQAALTDEWALNVTYRYDRGEPRISLKKGAELKAEGMSAGDCIDCGQCVAVCPTGVDIREGSQLACIQCGLCIDACDDVMNKIQRPTRLIAYDTDVNIKRRSEGKKEIYRPVRARTVIYAGMITMVSTIMIGAFYNRSFLDVSALHDRNPLVVHLSDGSIRNAYTVRIINKRNHDRELSLEVMGIPEAAVHIVGIDTVAGGVPRLAVGPDQTSEIRVLVTVPSRTEMEKSTLIKFRIADNATHETASATDHFIAR